MKLNTKTLATALFATVAPMQLAFAVTENGTAEATIQAAIAVTQNQVLDFATILPDPAGDTITLTSASAISSTSGGSALSGTPSAGQFAVTGDANAVVTLQFGTGAVLSGAGSDIPLANFTTPSLTPTMDGTGNLTFDVGADITIGASQAAGLYTGNYTVTVSYQ